MKGNQARAFELAAKAERVSHLLPPFLAQSSRSSGRYVHGRHGRRRSGTGEDFWQFRPAQWGDPLRLIDWRRSAKSDTNLVREREFQTATQVLFWVDRSLSMSFAGSRGTPAKGESAAILALAAAMQLCRSDERVGLLGSRMAPQSAMHMIEFMAAELAVETGEEYGLPPAPPRGSGIRVVLISDFLAPWKRLEPALRAFGQADHGIVMIQVLDVDEEEFPFDGRVIFESMARSLAYESLEAETLRDNYLDELEGRRSELSALAAELGGHFTGYRLGETLQPALLWLRAALGPDDPRY